METLFWCILIALVWCLSMRGPQTPEEAAREEEDERMRSWYAADFQKRNNRSF